jgi:hypothetical protein
VLGNHFRSVFDAILNLCKTPFELPCQGVK